MGPPCLSLPVLGHLCFDGVGMFLDRICQGEVTTQAERTLEEAVMWGKHKSRHWIYLQSTQSQQPETGRLELKCSYLSDEKSGLSNCLGSYRFG